MYDEKLLGTVAFSNGCLCSKKLTQREHRHFHPSGNLTPSKEDCMLTDRMLKLSELMGIPLVDHVIVGGNNESYFSFKEKDMLKFEHNKYFVDYRNIEFPQVAVADDTTVAEETVVPIRHKRR